MAALKSGCFVQAIEHCDKAQEIARFLLEQPAHPTAVKCLQRRATARQGLETTSAGPIARHVFTDLEAPLLPLENIL